jgi:Chitobiase/beta-hexosaminidase C-terminal domain/Glucodextranase, domain B/Bacterial Ig-like domain (group 2)
MTMQNRPRSTSQQATVVVGLILSSLLFASSAAAATAGAIGVPAPSSVQHQPFVFSGWAIDTSATLDPGVSSVRIKATPQGGGTPILIGDAFTRPSRPEVAAQYGQNFLNSDFGLTVTGLPPGTYTFSAEPFSTVTLSYGTPLTVTATVLGPAMSVEAPTWAQNVTQSFSLTGWAVDLRAPSGTGVYMMQAYAYKNGTGDPIDVGSTTTFHAKPAVAAAYGSQFTNSGFTINVSGLQQGFNYQIITYAWSTIDNTWNQSVTLSLNVDFTLTAPVLSPSPGSYSVGQTVTMTATSGAVIHYTTDGTDPTPSSTQYAGPVVIPQWYSATFKAKAFKVGFLASGTTSGTYQAGPQDTTPPAITTQVFPPAVGGWHNTNVQIFFSCTDTQSGIATCTSPVTVSTEGANQTTSGTAGDRNNNQASTNASVSIDKTPPTLTLTTLPPSETNSSQVSIAGSVSDTASGLAGVQCNGTNAPIVSGQFTCNVSLVPGLNLLAVTVADNAGNSASNSRRVQFGTVVGGPAAQTLRLRPNQFALQVGETRLVGLLDEYDREPETVAEWTSSDELVATVTEEGVITGIASGTATITAQVGTLSASVQVTVVAEGTPLTDGASYWELSARPDHSFVKVIDTPPSLGVTAFAIEHPTAPGGSVLVSALDDAGSVQWSASVPAVVGGPYIGDANGGFIADNGRVRVGPDGAMWVRPFHGAENLIGQSNGGTLFFFGGSGVMVVDGVDGKTQAAIPLAPSSHEFRGVCAEWPQPRKTWTVGGFTGSPVIDGAGTLHLFVKSSDSIDTCEPTPPIGETHTHFNSDRLELWSITSSGAKSVRTIAEQQVNDGRESYFDGGTIVPRNDDSLLLTWTENRWIPGTESYDLKHYIAHGATLSSKMAIPGGLGPTAMGDQNTVFMTSGGGAVAAWDADTFAPRWSTEADGLSIVATTRGGGVAVQQGDTLKLLSSSGTDIGQGPAPSGGVPMYEGGWRYNRTDRIVTSATRKVEFSNAFFQMPGGSTRGGTTGVSCEALRRHTGNGPLQLWFDPESIYEQPSVKGFPNSARTAFLGQAMKWRNEGYPGTIDLLPSDPAPPANSTVWVKWTLNTIAPEFNFNAQTYLAKDLLTNPSALQIQTRRMHFRIFLTTLSAFCLTDSMDCPIPFRTRRTPRRIPISGCSSAFTNPVIS